MAKKLFELLKDEVPKSELVDSLVEKIKETNDEIFKHKIILYLIELQRFNKINLVIVNTCYPANSATTIASFSLTNRGLIFDNDYFVVLEDLSDKVLVDKKDELLILIDRILDSEQVLSVVKQMRYFQKESSKILSCAVTEAQFRDLFKLGEIIIDGSECKEGNYDLGAIELSVVKQDSKVKIKINQDNGNYKLYLS